MFARRGQACLTRVARPAVPTTCVGEACLAPTPLSASHPTRPARWLPLGQAASDADDLLVVVAAAWHEIQRGHADVPRDKGLAIASRESRRGYPGQLALAEARQLSQWDNSHA